MIEQDERLSQEERTSQRLKLQEDRAAMEKRLARLIDEKKDPTPAMVEIRLLDEAIAALDRP